MAAPKPGSPVRGSRTGRPIMALLDLLGRRWTLRILWELRAGPLSFRALRERCGEISPTVLNRRLGELREASIVALAEGIGYVLTSHGQELLQLLRPLRAWAECWAERREARSGERVRTLILGGAHPYAEPLQVRQTILTQGLDAFVAASERSFGRYMTPTLRARLRATDVHALRAQTQDRPSIADVLPTMTMPCLLFAGETEPRLSHVRACLQHMPHGTFFVVPGCDHVGAWARSDLVLPYVTTFLAQHARPRSQRTGAQPGFDAH